MKWVKTCAGTFINLDHVAQFSFLRGDNPVQIVMDIDYSGDRSERHTIYTSDRADLENIRIPRQFCPSPPGYFVLYYSKEGSDETVHRDAILGWMLDITSDGYHTVVTTWDCHNSFDPTTAVLCADGTVVVPGNSRYEDEKSWLEAMRKLPIDKVA